MSTMPEQFVFGDSLFCIVDFLRHSVFDTLLHEPFRGFREAGEVEVEVGAEDVFGRVAGGVGFAGAVFGEEEGVRDFFERLGAGEVEFVSAQFFAFHSYDCIAQRARRDVADCAQAVVHFAAHWDYAAHFMGRAFEVFYLAR